MNSYIVEYLDKNDLVSLMGNLNYAFFTKKELEGFLEDYKNAHKELLLSYTNNVYNEKDVDFILDIQDKINLLTNNIKKYDIEKEKSKDLSNLFGKIDDFNKKVETYLDNCVRG